MKAILYEGPRKVSLQEVPTPEIGPGEALVAVEACGLCGTDLLKIDTGNLPPPLPLGHEVAGRIAAAGKGLKGFKKGDRVMVAHHVPCGLCHFCSRGSPTKCRQFKETNLDPGGFSQFIRVSAKHAAATMLPIPKELSFAAASQVEPLACCVRNVGRLGLREGDLCVIIGLGAIGLMTAQLLRRRGATVVGLDLTPDRVRLAQKLGVEHAYTGKDGRTRQLIADLTEGRGADAAVFTAGSPALAAERLSWLRDGGALNVFAGFHPDPHMRLDLNELYRREISITASYSAAPEDLKEALALIASGAVDLEPFIHDVFPLERFHEAARRARGRELLKAILLPQKSNGKAP